MYRFFVSPDQIADGKTTITGDDVNHIRNVLRMKEGDEVRISNGIDHDYYCILRDFSSESIIAEICYEERDSTELPVKIHLFQGLPKGDKMELILQKAVELGAFEVIPVSMKRCVVKLDQKRAQTKIKRWTAISESAAKQSKRRIIPEVKPLMTYHDALDYAKEFTHKFLPYENEKGMALTRELFKTVGKEQDIALFIGPEGGFDEKEVELAKSKGFIPISLGSRILRTETAGMAALSMLVYELDE